jgi:hypothetical protein
MRHLDVHEEHVREEGRGKADRLEPILRDADDLDLRGAC